jgi:hypothetical protein
MKFGSRNHGRTPLRDFWCPRVEFFDDGRVVLPRRPASSREQVGVIDLGTTSRQA